MRIDLRLVTGMQLHLLRIHMVIKLEILSSCEKEVLLQTALVLNDLLPPRRTALNVLFELVVVLAHVLVTVGWSLQLGCA